MLLIQGFKMSDYSFIKLIREDEKIIIAEMLPNEIKKNVLQFEMKRLKEFVPFINKGIHQVFNEAEQMLIVRKSYDEKFFSEKNANLTLKNEHGQIVGEEINDEEILAELHQRDDVRFLSDNFVTFSSPTRELGEKQFFELSSAKIELITQINLDEYVSSITVGLPSIESVDYIKDCFKIPNEKYIIAIIGFTLKKSK